MAKFQKVKRSKNAIVYAGVEEKSSYAGIRLAVTIYLAEIHRRFAYLRHTIIMFNPTNLDEVCVQATHLEAREKNVQEEGKNKPFQSGEKGKKFKEKQKKNSSVKKEGEKTM